MSDHTPIDPARIHRFEQQTISLPDLADSGLILDIGGGGEGTIGRIRGAQVVAIDTNRGELEEAPSGPLKIVMDATALQFLDGAFPTATAFCTFMYIPKGVRSQVMTEVYRVLTPGGMFYVWDMILPPRLNKTKDVAAFMLKLVLPDGEEVPTGYGVLWPEDGCPPDFYINLAQAAGFEVLDSDQKENLVFLRLRKPIIE
jgi:ubiquinone/menaquinone biosynthesis C-methylase UbiE